MYGKVDPRERLGESTATCSGDGVLIRATAPDVTRASDELWQLQTRQEIWREQDIRVSASL